MTISETIAYIQQFSKSGKTVSDLSRIQALLEALGNPQERLRFVHVAGTNGKGSVVAYCAAASIAAGFRTGQFTSPFVRHYQDRIQVNGTDIADERLCALCEQVIACHASQACSQFEITFAIALLYFVEQQCDIVFLETGLGGLLDATNVITAPLVSVITSISFDHMAILGDTLPKIATQKAGIIKESRPVVLSPDNPEEVQAIIKKTAARNHTAVTIPDLQSCEVKKETLTTMQFCYQGVSYTLHMTGQHQIYNAVTAISVLHLLRAQGFSFPDDVISRALATVQLPARIQILQKSPLVLVDGGHNPSGAAAFAAVLRKTEKRPVVGILGMVQGKDYHAVTEILSEVMDVVICVDDFSPQAVPAKTLAACFPTKVNTFCMPHQVAMEAACMMAEADGCVAVSGSLYLSSAFLEQDSIHL
jgi:dihydrofolate synthase/folylpolyglutamate synthase